MTWRKNWSTGLTSQFDVDGSGPQADFVYKRDPLMEVIGTFRIGVIDVMYMDDLKKFGDKKIKATTCSSPSTIPNRSLLWVVSWISVLESFMDAHGIGIGGPILLWPSCAPKALGVSSRMATGFFVGSLNHLEDYIPCLVWRLNGNMATWKWCCKSMLPSLCVREIQLEREPPFTSTFMEENEHGFVSKPKNKSDRHLCLSNKIHHDIVVLQYAMATAGTMDPLPWTRSQTTGGEVGEKCLAMCFCVGWCSLGAVLVAVGTEFLVMINGYRTLFSRLKSCNYFGEKT